MQVLQPQGLFINKPFYTSIHKPCFYTSPAFKQALLLHKSVFTQDLLLHKPCFYTSAVFTQALLLHKTCFYTNAVFTQALSLHKHCLYTRPAFTQKRFYTRPPFTQTLSLHKLCLYTSIAFIQALLLHNDILLTKAFCNLQTGNRLEGRRNAEGCKYILSISRVCVWVEYGRKIFFPSTKAKNRKTWPSSFLAMRSSAWKVILRQHVAKCVAFETFQMWKKKNETSCFFRWHPSFCAQTGRLAACAWWIWISLSCATPGLLTRMFWGRDDIRSPPSATNVSSPGISEETMCLGITFEDTIYESHMKHLFRIWSTLEVEAFIHSRTCASPTFIEVVHRSPIPGFLQILYSRKQCTIIEYVSPKFLSLHPWSGSPCFGGMCPMFFLQSQIDVIDDVAFRPS